jgi:hypothetical protein
MGRTLRDAQVRVHGVPLPFTEYWPGAATLRLPISSTCSSAGLRARAVELATVRGDFERPEVSAHQGGQDFGRGLRRGNR